MNVSLEIAEAYRSHVSKKSLETAAQVTLQHQNAPSNTVLTIVITSDELVHELNREYRDIDAPTDVLSFRSEFLDPENNTFYLGDVIVSYPLAEVQAAASGHSTEDELQLLIVHGVLHLMGHDHGDPDEKERMWAVQDKILTQLGKAGIAP
jgi:probable rRNA maturation factor